MVQLLVSPFDPPRRRGDLESGPDPRRDLPPLNGARTLLWFLKRPRLYPELARRARRKLARGETSDEASRAEALDWYESLAVATEQALELVLGVRPAVNFRERHQSEL